MTISWECPLCDKKNPDKRDFCRRKYRRQSCIGYNPDIVMSLEFQKYIAFLTMMMDFEGQSTIQV